MKSKQKAVFTRIKTNFRRIFSVNMVDLEVDKICRVCLKPDPCLSPLFDMNNTIDGVTFSDMISECTMNLISRNNQLPDQICFACIERLENAYCFKKLCEASHLRLLAFLASMGKDDRGDVGRNMQPEPSISSLCQPFIKVEFEPEAEAIHEETPVRIKKENEDLSCAFETECQDLKYCPPQSVCLQSEIDPLEEHLSGAMESTASVEAPSEQNSDPLLMEKAKLEETSEETLSENTEDSRHQFKRSVKKRKLATGEDEAKEKPFQCKKCFKRYVGRVCLNNHMATHNGKTFNCKMCSKKFSWPAGLRKHMQLHKGEFQCKQCNECFGTESFLKAHELEAHIPYTPKPYQCDECPWTFKRRSGLNTHKLYVHTDSRPHSCICEKSFKTNKCLLAHIAYHKSGDHGPKRRPSDDEKAAYLYTKTEDRPFQCELCLRTFSRKDNFVVHMRMHERIPTKETFPCPICKVELKGAVYLEKHIANHSRAFQCNFCGNCFDHKSQLDRHERQDHGVEGPIPKFTRAYKDTDTTVVKPETPQNTHFECNQCQKVFKSNGLLRHHLLTHTEKNFECALCPARFHMSKSLRVHMLRHGDLFKCSQCEQTFGAEFILKIHERNVHPKKLFNCDQCSRVFKHKVSHEKHMRHHAENREKCKICEKLVKPQYIRRHMKDYHQQKQFICEKCGAKFSQAFLLERHNRHHTKQEQRKLKAESRSECDQESESTSIEVAHSKDEQ